MIDEHSILPELNFSEEFSSLGTKLKGDIAEQAAVLQALKFGWGVLRPVGDRLPYDLVFDLSGTFARVQVKSSWFSAATGNSVVDSRRTKTNRRKMVREVYKTSDFDFALLYIEDLNIFYVLPIDVFIGYGSEIHLVEADRRQRRPQSSRYRDAWHLISQWAVCEGTRIRTPLKFGEAFSSGNPEPSLHEVLKEGVET